MCECVSARFGRNFIYYTYVRYARDTRRVVIRFLIFFFFSTLFFYTRKNEVKQPLFTIWFFFSLEYYMYTRARYRF